MKKLKSFEDPKLELICLLASDIIVTSDMSEVENTEEETSTNWPPSGN